MIIDVGDPGRNLILNVCFVAILVMAALSLVPWSLLGARGLGRLAAWLPAPVLVLAYVYETVMPSNYDIRIDLVVLLPAYGVVGLATLARVITRRRRTHQRR